MRIVLADDSVLFREGMARLLADRGVDVVAQANDGSDLVRKVDAYAPDAAIVDIRMPPTHTDEGLQAAREIFSAQPEVGIMVLSQHVESDLARELLEERPGGLGYLLKDRVRDIDHFVASVQEVAAGGAVVDPLIATRLLSRRRAPDALELLSDRELEVLELMAQGATNHAIAQRLFLSERTVESHTGAIFRKLGIDDSADAHRRVLAVIAYLSA